MRQADHAEVREALRRQLDVLVAGLAERDPDGPTDCAGWVVADLENHMAGNLIGLAAVAERKVDQAPDGGVAQWSTQLEQYADLVGEQGRQGRRRVADHVAEALQALDDFPASTVVTQLTGRHTLTDAAIFRVVEAVVHGLDVAITPDPAALKLVVKELARAFADLHPGRSVEVRIPPYTAVQCLDGPRHTRGTPPNVVEAEPVAWVRLATGRESWHDLVRTGRVTASGERSELSALMPLLR